MTIEDDIAFLERVPILQRLGAGALRILAIGAESYTVQEGQMLFSGRRGRRLRLCRAGRLVHADAGTAQRRRDDRRARHVARRIGLARRKRCGPRPRPRASRLTVLRISRAMFLKMLESFPDAAQRLRELIAARADQWAREMDNVRAALARGTGPQHQR